jgi:hypothetical protein
VFEVLADPLGPVFGFVDGDATPGGVAVLLTFFAGPGVGQADVDGVVQIESLAVPGRDDRVRGDVRVVGGVDTAVWFGRGGLLGRAVPSGW